MRLTWKREERERGLAAVCQGERGYDLRMNGEELASVRPCYEGWSRNVRGYYWYCGQNDDLGIMHHNTHKTPRPTIEQAKSECLAYIKTCLAGGRLK